jgi:hypothetical protein
MKPLPRLRIELIASRIAPRLLASATVATSVLAFLTIVQPLACAIAVCACGAIGLRAVRSAARPPLLMHVGIDRRIRVTLRNGRIVDGTVHADTSVGAGLTSIVWRRDAARWFRLADTLLVLPDMLPADDFRRLRVYLRYGRAADDAGTSGVSAA